MARVEVAVTVGAVGRAEEVQRVKAAGVKAAVKAAEAAATEAEATAGVAREAAATGVGVVQALGPGSGREAVAVMVVAAMAGGAMARGAVATVMAEEHMEEAAMEMAEALGTVGAVKDWVGALGRLVVVAVGVGGKALVGGQAVAAAARCTQRG
mmetsp:Transcript_67541/g.201901  ORF Transcript_67541/g.201901 Transcript_67541/m.201901 type:complete len:154 (+) Transcript_67541:385-846(+)